MSAALKVLRPRRRVHDPASEELWALRHVDLQIDVGEAVAIIGHNGAGKTTLLKILSRITEPTEGRASFTGRVGSLLEVGTGFHPELSGRENIYLNGAILGMHRSETKRKFDDIVEFAEVGRFLETPVKRYSSGMYVRLAFSVAAHLEPDILVVDEVLAVGDVDFQRRCIGKMDDVARSGRTVLFVSHNMAAVSRLCQRAAWLEHGEVLQQGPVDSVVASYLSAGTEFQGERVWPDGARRAGVTQASVHAVRILDQNGVTGVIDASKSFNVEIDYDVHEPARSLTVGVQLRRSDGVAVFHSYDCDDPSWSEQRLPGRYRAACEIPGNLLNVGMYSLTVDCILPNVRILARQEGALAFEIEDLGLAGSETERDREGVIRPQLPWRSLRLD
jgi:lipopolysaccharide transport system ATP-binding protein